jgi:trehalose-6-phosphatase
MNHTIKTLLKDIKNGKTRTVWFDIDGTIASTSGTNYYSAEPNEDIIKLINMLYDRGCNIYIITARGSGSGINWRKTTEDQLSLWGVKYHKLIMGYRRDMYVGDEVLRPDEFLEMIE